MRKFNFFKGLFATLLLGSAASVTAQVYHPLAYSAVGGGKNNWNANYVGVSLTVNSPAAVAGNKNYTIANDNTGNTNNWGGAVTTPIINVQALKGPSSDTDGCTAFPAGYFAGKIALIYRGTCNFSCKSQNAQDAGAIACVIINNVPGGPVGMALGTCTGTTIPVFMISQEDGLPLFDQINAGNNVYMSFTPWGQGLAHDLGIIDNGGAQFPAYAMPFYQLNGNTNPYELKNVDGAFIANFGNNSESGVKLASTLSWTPTGGSTSEVRHDSIVDPNPLTVADSIIAMYEPTPYNLNATGTGRFDLTYNLSMNNTDLYTGNNSLTYSMYTTDRIWSKGRYDFTKNQPVSTIWYGTTGATPISWGPNFYVAKGGYAAESLQFSIAQSGNGVFPDQTEFDLYAFKWVDGYNDGVTQYPKDGFIEGGELIMVGKATYLTNGVDSSEEYLTAPIFGMDGTSKVYLEDTSWYWFPAVTASGFYIGCDGVLDFLPRTYGKYHNMIGATNDSTYIEPYASLWGDDANNISTNATTYYPSFAFDKAEVDSVNYANQRGLIPNIAMINSLHPMGVETTTPLSFTVNVYPNPATNVVNVSMNNTKVASKVTYTVIDALARFVTREEHTNVINDKFTYNTEKLPAGNYYVSVTIDGRSITKKFVVLK